MSETTPAVAASAAISPSPTRALRWYAWGVVAYNVAVILDGALVRATGSGNGCGDHWPLCNGEIVQQHPKIATMIEYAHRATSGIAFLAVLVLVIWTFRGTVKRHMARVAAVWSLIFIFNEALIGALLVLLGMTANNQSPSRAFYLALHLTNTLLMLAALTLTADFLSRRRGFMRGSVELRGVWLVSAGLLGVILTGVTGSLAALADTLHPEYSLRAALAQDFSSHSSWLIRIRWVHPVLSLIAGLILLEILLRATRHRAHHRVATVLIVLLLLQYGLGLTDLALLTPLTMQVLHLLGADLLWIVLVILAAQLCLRPTGCEVEGCG